MTDLLNDPAGYFAHCGGIVKEEFILGDKNKPGSWRIYKRGEIQAKYEGYVLFKGKEPDIWSPESNTWALGPIEFVVDGVVKEPNYYPDAYRAKWFKENGGTPGDFVYGDITRESTWKLNTRADPLPEGNEWHMVYEVPPTMTTLRNDPINHPSHYTAYKGIEVIQLTEQMNFNKGNAVKYISRAGLKDPNTEIQDLEKAAWYINREIERLKNAE